MSSPVIPRTSETLSQPLERHSPGSLFTDASIQWYKKFDNFIQSVGFSKSDEDHCLFTKKTQDGSPVFLIIYVEDMLHSGQQAGEVTELVRKLRLKFGMKDVGLARHILGMKISRNRDRQ